MMVTYPIPSPASYDSSMVPEAENSSGAQWEEPGTDGETAAQDSVGVNHAARKADNAKTFIAGALIASPASLSAGAVEALTYATRMHSDYCTGVSSPPRPDLCGISEVLLVTGRARPRSGGGQHLAGRAGCGRRRGSAGSGPARSRRVGHVVLQRGPDAFTTIAGVRWHPVRRYPRRPRVFAAPRKHLPRVGGPCLRPMTGPTPLHNHPSPQCADASGHQRESFCVKRLAGASSVVCPCIAVTGLVPAARDRVEETTGGAAHDDRRGKRCVLNAAEGSPRPPA